MFDEIKYRACFDEVVPPEGMEKEILKMTICNNVHRHRYCRTAIVLAAALALLLSFGAVAYAAGWFNVEDAVIGSVELSGEVGPVISSDAEAEDFICLSGVKGSPEYEAQKEWFEYYWSEFYQVVGADESIENPVYNQYGAFSQSSIDKLDEICEKYGLELMDAVASALEESDFSGLLREDDNRVLGGYSYNCGSFMIEGNAELPGGTPVSYQLINYQKGYFANGGRLNIGAWEDYEQWDYTTAEGVTVTIVHSGSRDIVLADLENSVVAINVVDFDEVGRSRADMEAFADCFDFTAIK